MLSLSDIGKIKDSMDYPNLNSMTANLDDIFIIPGFDYGGGIKAGQMASMNGKWQTLVEINQRGALQFDGGIFFLMSNHQNSRQYCDSCTVEFEIDLGYKKYSVDSFTVPNTTVGNVIMVASIRTGSSTTRITNGNYGVVGKQIEILIPLFLKCDKFIVRYKLTFSGMKNTAINNSPDAVAYPVNPTGSTLHYYLDRG